VFSIFGLIGGNNEPEWNASRRSKTLEMRDAAVMSDGSG
jgi:hypothetical protein